MKLNEAVKKAQQIFVRKIKLFVYFCLKDKKYSESEN